MFLDITLLQPDSTNPQRQNQKQHVHFVEPRARWNFRFGSESNSKCLKGKREVDSPRSVRINHFQTYGRGLEFWMNVASVLVNTQVLNGVNLICDERGCCFINSLNAQMTSNGVLSTTIQGRFLYNCPLFYRQILFLKNIPSK